MLGIWAKPPPPIQGLKMSLKAGKSHVAMGFFATEKKRANFGTRNLLLKLDLEVVEEAVEDSEVIVEDAALLEEDEALEAVVESISTTTTKPLSIFNSLTHTHTHILFLLFPN